MSDDSSAVGQSPAAGEPGASARPAQPAAAVSTPAAASPAAGGADEYFVDVATIEGAPVTAEHRRGLAALGQHLRSQGVPAGISNAAWSWMEEHSKLAATAPLGPQQAIHSYQVAEHYGFAQDDQAPLTAFLNTMSEKGATQQDVDGLLATYVRLRDADDGGSGGDARDRADYAKARRVLGQDWSAQSARFAMFYVETLPPEQRAELEDSAELFSPAKMKEMARAGRALVGSNRYRQDPRLRAIYANMVGKQSAGAANVGEQSSVDRELEQIRQVMRTNITKYRRDENMQRRYRQLLETK